MNPSRSPGNLTGFSGIPSFSSGSSLSYGLGSAWRAEENEEENRGEQDWDFSRYRFQAARSTLGKGFEGSSSSTRGLGGMGTKTGFQLPSSWMHNREGRGEEMEGSSPYSGSSPSLIMPSPYGRMGGGGGDGIPSSFTSSFTSHHSMGGRKLPTTEDEDAAIRKEEIQLARMQLAEAQEKAKADRMGVALVGAGPSTVETWKALHAAGFEVQAVLCVVDEEAYHTDVRAALQPSTSGATTADAGRATATSSRKPELGGGKPWTISPSPPSVTASSSFGESARDGRGGGPTGFGGRRVYRAGGGVGGGETRRPMWSDKIRRSKGFQRDYTTTTGGSSFGEGGMMIPSTGTGKSNATSLSSTRPGFSSSPYPWYCGGAAAQWRRSPRTRQHLAEMCAVVDWCITVHQLPPPCTPSLISEPAQTATAAPGTPSLAESYDRPCERDQTRGIFGERRREERPFSPFGRAGMEVNSAAPSSSSSSAPPLPPAPPPRHGVHVLTMEDFFFHPTYAALLASVQVLVVEPDLIWCTAMSTHHRLSVEANASAVGGEGSILTTTTPAVEPSPTPPCIPSVLERLVRLCLQFGKHLVLSSEVMNFFSPTRFPHYWNTLLSSYATASASPERGDTQQNEKAEAEERRGRGGSGYSSRSFGAQGATPFSVPLKNMNSMREEEDTARQGFFSVEQRLLLAPSLPSPSAPILFLTAPSVGWWSRPSIRREWPNRIGAPFLPVFPSSSSSSSSAPTTATTSTNASFSPAGSDGVLPLPSTYPSASVSAIGKLQRLDLILMVPAPSDGRDALYGAREEQEEAKKKEEEEEEEVLTGGWSHGFITSRGLRVRPPPPSSSSSSSGLVSSTTTPTTSARLPGISAGGAPPLSYPSFSTSFSPSTVGHLNGKEMLYGTLQPPSPRTLDTLVNPLISFLTGAATSAGNTEENPAEEAGPSNNGEEGEPDRLQDVQALVVKMHRGGEACDLMEETCLSKETAMHSLPATHTTSTAPSSPPAWDETAEAPHTLRRGLREWKEALQHGRVRPAPFPRFRLMCTPPSSSSSLPPPTTVSASSATPVPFPRVAADVFRVLVRPAVEAVLASMRWAVPYGVMATIKELDPLTGAALTISGDVMFAAFDPLPSHGGGTNALPTSVEAMPSREPLSSFSFSTRSHSSSPPAPTKGATEPFPRSWMEGSFKPDATVDTSNGGKDTASNESKATGAARSAAAALLPTPSIPTPPTSVPHPIPAHFFLSCAPGVPLTQSLMAYGTSGAMHMPDPWFPTGVEEEKEEKTSTITTGARDGSGKDALEAEKDAWALSTGRTVNASGVTLPSSFSSSPSMTFPFSSAAPATTRRRVIPRWTFSYWERFSGSSSSASSTSSRRGKFPMLPPSSPSSSRFSRSSFSARTAEKEGEEKHRKEMSSFSSLSLFSPQHEHLSMDPTMASSSREGETSVAPGSSHPLPSTTTTRTTPSSVRAEGAERDPERSTTVPDGPFLPWRLPSVPDHHPHPSMKETVEEDWGWHIRRVKQKRKKRKEKSSTSPAFTHGASSSFSGRGGGKAKEEEQEESEEITEIMEEEKEGEGIEESSHWIQVEKTLQLPPEIHAEGYSWDIIRKALQTREELQARRTIRALETPVERNPFSETSRTPQGSTRGGRTISPTTTRRGYSGMEDMESGMRGGGNFFTRFGTGGGWGEEGGGRGMGGSRPSSSLPTFGVSPPFSRYDSSMRMMGGTSSGTSSWEEGGASAGMGRPPYPGTSSSQKSSPSSASASSSSKWVLSDVEGAKGWCWRVWLVEQVVESIWESSVTAAFTTLPSMAGMVPKKDSKKEKKEKKTDRKERERKRNEKRKRKGEGNIEGEKINLNHKKP